MSVRCIMHLARLPFLAQSVGLAAPVLTCVHFPRECSQRARHYHAARSAGNACSPPSLAPSSSLHSGRVARPPSSSRPMSTDSPESRVIFSKDQPDDISSRLDDLCEWTITPTRMGIVRKFTFPTFSAAWRFMDAVAGECKRARHHPSWHNLYNEVTVEWTTHKPLGLSIKDIEMAEFCDRTAQDIGLRAKA